MLQDSWLTVTLIIPWFRNGKTNPCARNNGLSYFRQRNGVCLPFFHPLHGRLSAFPWKVGIFHFVSYNPFACSSRWRACLIPLGKPRDVMRWRTETQRKIHGISEDTVPPSSHSVRWNVAVMCVCVCVKRSFAGKPGARFCKILLTSCLTGTLHEGLAKQSERESARGRARQTGDSECQLFKLHVLFNLAYQEFLDYPSG